MAVRLERPLTLRGPSWTSSVPGPQTDFPLEDGVEVTVALTYMATLQVGRHSNCSAFKAIRDSGGNTVNEVHESKWVKAGL